MVLPLYLLTLLPLSAQTFTQRIQQTKQGEGTVTIHQDPAIDELVNGPQPSQQQTTPRPATPKKEDKPNSGDAPKGNSTHKSDTPKSDTTETGKPVQTVDTTTVAVPQGRPFKTTGYRVQVFAGGNTRKDRQKAERTGNNLRQLFPGEDVYVRFYSPRWVCRVGNYLSYEEAHEKLLLIRKMGYETATIVKGKIIVYND
jgi:hypothetical protein